MFRQLAGASMCLAALVMAQGCATSARVDRLEEELRQADFAQVIKSAKRKVFPVIVYLKPIQETFAGGKKAEVETIGSGVVVSRDGYVVTNSHVAQKATQIRAVLFNEKQTTATLVGLDKDTDLALLKLDFDEEDLPLPYAEFGDSSGLEEGNFVMAMGCPLGLTRSISFGVVSNTKRYLGERLSRYTLWIQTDAAINPGNSGGPLVDTEGKIVGINALGTVRSENIGFSIPSNVVQAVIAQLKDFGQVRRAWTGIRFQALKDFESNTFVEGDRGVLAADVEPDSPAAEAGLRARDLILALDGLPVDGVFVEDLPAVRARFAALEPGEEAALTVERNGREVELRLTPIIKGKVEGDDFDCKEWQMTIKEINKFATRQMYYFRKQGVYVQGVKNAGNARRSGLAPGDIILTIGDDEIRSLDDARETYEKLNVRPDDERYVLIKVLRSGVPRLVRLDFRKRDSEYEEEQ